MSQKLKHSLNDQLIDLRNRGLESVRNTSAIKAHGKFAGMDTFSWVNPDMDTFARMIESMPMGSIWVGEVEQFYWLFKHYPECVKRVHAAIVFDEIPPGATDWLNAYKNVAFTKGVTDVLMFVKALEGVGKSFFFTASGAHALACQSEFEMYLS